MTEKAKKWSDDTVAQLLKIAGSANPVSVERVEQAAETLGVTVRSVASKLRQLDREVASMAKEKVSAFTPEQTSALAKFVNANAGVMTYKDIAETFEHGAFSAKQIQGKLLALELTGSVKPAEKVEAARTYSDQEEATFIKMAQAGKYIEEIAITLGKSIPSVRGKALSLTRKGQIDRIPTQKDSHAKNTVDPVVALGTSIASMTVAEIAKAVDKTERGLKTLLTRRGISVKDYDGAAKKAKAEAKAA
jgi:arsenate reductase-like glutaredoxin family protein